MAYYVNGVRCDTPEEALALRRAQPQQQPQPESQQPMGRDAYHVEGHPAGCDCNRCENYRLPWHY